MSTSNPKSAPLGMIAGSAIGLLWIAIALVALWSAMTGFRQDRLDWGVGWGLVGVLLFAAGSAAIVGSWWHQNRVLRDESH
jgi:dipeptide/tripeptide permease